jgi:3-hydroxyethyl bacteriochlorophyllide a dehydrogenase
VDTKAVLLEAPETLRLSRVPLLPAAADDVVVDIAWSGISTGTERLLYTGRMPMFPGMGYPLVPGYESVGQVVEAGRLSQRRVGETVFVPGARCFGELDGKPVRGLFGGAASRLVLPGAKARPVPDGLGEQAVLLALAATAQHALAGGALPGLIIGHGVLGRLLARLVVAHGAAPPTVWETNPARHDGALGYQVLLPENDPKRDYAAICDASGDATLLDALIGRLAFGGEIALAGFYAEPLSFAFPPAFMREARLRIAAEWKPADLATVLGLLDAGTLSLDGLITHRVPAAEAPTAYRTAFGDAACLKMILDWSGCA